MRYGENRDVRWQSDKHDVVREIVNWQPADIRVVYTGNVGTGRLEALEVLQRLRDFERKSSCCVVTSGAVPIGRLTQLLARSCSEPYACQRDSTSR